MIDLDYDEQRALLGLPDVLPPSFPFPGRARLYTGLERGIAWCIYLSPLSSSLNGYAHVPFGVFINPDRLDVHGGITYVGEGDETWVGFDTAHGGDWWDLDELRARIGVHVHASGLLLNEFEHEMATKFPHMGRAWNVDRMIAECRRLAGQIAAVRSEQYARFGPA